MRDTDYIIIKTGETGISIQPDTLEWQGPDIITHKLHFETVRAIGITDEHELFKAVDDMWNEAYPGRR